MAYIYIITNKLNDKSYIGKTEHNIPNKRWEEHCKDYKRDYYKNRPLYKAMNKYGLKVFEFKILFKTNTPEKDEIELIKKYNTYKKGYNATLGGDGKKLIDNKREKEIVNYYLKNPYFSYNDLKKVFNHDKRTLKNILKKYNVTYKYEDTKENLSKKVFQYDLENKLIATFKSSSDAARLLGSVSKNAHITSCCNKKRKTAYGYKWSWVISKELV